MKINLAEFQKCNVECTKQIAKEMAHNHFFKLQKQAKLNNVFFGDTCMIKKIFFKGHIKHQIQDSIHL